ncbi:unnamed protein product, partial [Prorocentrum cordatum]
GRKNRRTKRRTTTRQKEREREAEAGRLAGRKRGGNRFLDRLLDSSLFGRARQMRAELPRTHYHQTSARVFCSILAAFPQTSCTGLSYYRFALYWVGETQGGRRGRRRRRRRGRKGRRSPSEQPSTPGSGSRALGPAGRTRDTNPAEVWVTPAWKSLYTRLS